MQQNGCQGATVMLFSRDGEPRWSHVLNPISCGAGEIVPTGVALTPDAEVLLSGRVSGEVKLGGTQFSPEWVAGFVLRLGAVR